MCVCVCVCVSESFIRVVFFLRCVRLNNVRLLLFLLDFIFHFLSHKVLFQLKHTHTTQATKAEDVCVLPVSVCHEAARAVVGQFLTAVKKRDAGFLCVR